MSTLPIEYWCDYPNCQLKQFHTPANHPDSLNYTTAYSVTYTDQHSQETLKQEPELLLHSELKEAQKTMGDKDGKIMVCVSLDSDCMGHVGHYWMMRRDSRFGQIDALLVKPGEDCAIYKKWHEGYEIL